jgi:hypothetical protein
MPVEPRVPHWEKASLQRRERKNDASQTERAHVEFAAQSLIDVVQPGNALDAAGVSDRDS